MGNLASTPYEQGELERARALEERVLEARRRLLGEEHPDTLGAMGNLAMPSTLRVQGEVESASQLEHLVEEIRQRQAERRERGST